MQTLNPRQLTAGAQTQGRWSLSFVIRPHKSKPQGNMAPGLGEEAMQRRVRISKCKEVIAGDAHAKDTYAYSQCVCVCVYVCVYTKVLQNHVWRFRHMSKLRHSHCGLCNMKKVLLFFFFKLHLTVLRSTRGGPFGHCSVGNESSEPSAPPCFVHPFFQLSLDATFTLNL